MICFLAQRWFLLLVVLGLGLAWLAPGSLAWTRRVPPQAIMAASLFLAAWTLESHRLYQACRRPWPALWALAISYGLLPILGSLAAPLLPDSDCRIGLMVIVSVPCTMASAVLWTRMAGGNEASALLITFLTTSLSCLATTFWLALGTGSQVDINTGAVMRGLALVLVLPVAVGQAVRAVPPIARFATRHRTSIGVASRLLILLIVLRAAVEVSDRLRNDAESVDAVTLMLAAVACVGIHMAGLAAGFWSSSIFGFDRPNRIAVAIGGSQKTLPVSLYLFDVYFHAFPLAVVPMVCFFLGQLVVDTFVADTLARREQPKGPAQLEIVSL